MSESVSERLGWECPPDRGASEPLPAAVFTIVFGQHGALVECPGRKPNNGHRVAMSMADAEVLGQMDELARAANREVPAIYDPPFPWRGRVVRVRPHSAVATTWDPDSRVLTRRYREATGVGQEHGYLGECPAGPVYGWMDRERLVAPEHERRWQVPDGVEVVLLP